MIVFSSYSTNWTFLKLPYHSCYEKQIKALLTAVDLTSPLYSFHNSLSLSPKCFSVWNSMRSVSRFLCRWNQPVLHKSTYQHAYNVRKNSFHLALRQHSLDKHQKFYFANAKIFNKYFMNMLINMYFINIGRTRW